MFFCPQVVKEMNYSSFNQIENIEDREQNPEELTQRDDHVALCLLDVVIKSFLVTTTVSADTFCCSLIQV